MQEYTTSQDKFFDYCLYQYTPNVPYEGKLRSSNLLLNSFDVMGCERKFYELVNAIKTRIGENRTVWGIKKENNRFAWEFYFYDYLRKRPEVTLANMIDVVSPFFKVPIKANDALPYFMFSMDITQEIFQKKQLDCLHIYIPGVSDHPNGFCYLLSKNGMKLENHYDFFYPKTRLPDIVAKIRSSGFVDFTQADLDEVLLPELTDCWTICIANKQKNDGIYFSRVKLKQFIIFLEKFEFPDRLTAYIKQNQDKLDHLLYDVAFDYRTKSDKIVITKSGYYGTF